VVTIVQGGHRRRLLAFCAAHSTARSPLNAWIKEAESAHWETPQQIRARFRSADFVGGARIAFNIGGNKFRLIVRVVYASKAHDLGGILFIRFIGAYEEYDAVDAATV
jgi:mRNA interferase HigB